MKGFIESNLISGEEIVHKAVIHWFIFLEAFFWALLGLITYLMFAHAVGMNPTMAAVMGAAMALVGAVKAASAIFHKYFTELVVTNRRMMAKFGFIRRETIEIPLLKIESVTIDQSILERIFGSGTVSVRGTGTGMAPVRYIDEPIEFRNELNEAIAEARSQLSKDDDFYGGKT